MNDVIFWWDDAMILANSLAEQTRLRHRVTAVRDMVEGEYAVIGWRVDLADGEHVLAAAAAENLERP